MDEPIFYFTDDFNWTNAKKAAGYEKAKQKSVEFCKAREKFEKSVISALVNDLKFSDSFIIPDWCSDSVKRNLIEELNRKFPNRVQIYSWSAASFNV